MTRTTLKALWIGGSGILATWVAVSPNHAVPAATAQPAAIQQPAPSVPSAEQLSAQAVRLRERNAELALPPSTRNPFRYSEKSPSGAEHIARERDVEPMALEPSVAAAPAPPAVILSGVAEKAGKRSAIMTIDGQIYIAGDGEAFGGGYTVVKVDPETVLIRDAAGAGQRLVLR